MSAARAQPPPLPRPTAPFQPLRWMCLLATGCGAASHPTASFRVSAHDGAGDRQAGEGAEARGHLSPLEKMALFTAPRGRGRSEKMASKEGGGGEGPHGRAAGYLSGPGASPRCRCTAPAPVEPPCLGALHGPPDRLPECRPSVPPLFRSPRPPSSFPIAGGSVPAPEEGFTVAQLLAH